MAYSVNQVQLLGRLTRDPQVSYTAATQICCTRFSLAIDNGKTAEGKERPADFPSIVVWGKLAEYADKSLEKGQRCFISGKVKTGSYDRNGTKVYFTEIVANVVIPMEKCGTPVQQGGNTAAQQTGTADFDARQMEMGLYDELIPDDDIPF